MERRMKKKKKTINDKKKEEKKKTNKKNETKQIRGNVRKKEQCYLQNWRFIMTEFIMIKYCQYVIQSLFVDFVR